MQKNKLSASLLNKKLCRILLLSFAIFFQTQIYSQTVSTFAGSVFGGSNDGTGTAANFYQPGAIARDQSGNLYVADSGNHKIRKITPEGVVTTIAGTGIIGDADGNGLAASFNYPYGITIDLAGNLYIADLKNNKIRKITTSGEVTTLAGSGVEGSSDGTGIAASFDSPHGITVDTSGNIYVTDGKNHKIRKITSSGDVTTFAGSGNSGFANGTGTAASFNTPSGIVTDSYGNLYVTDQYNNMIRKITPQAEVTTFAGSGSTAFANGEGISAGFAYPTAISIDGSGNLYVFDAHMRIRKITSTGFVTPFAGSGLSGYVDGLAADAQFFSVVGIASDPSGEEIYLIEDAYNIIRKIVSCSLEEVTPLATLTHPTTSIPYGSITVTSPIGDFEYSIDNINYQKSILFENVQPGSVQLTARKTASTDCISLPANLIIKNISIQPAPINTRIAAGISHSLAVCDDGTVRAWGNNSYGCLGTGDDSQSKVPLTVKSLTGIVAVAAGESLSVAIKEDGTVWTWGVNIYGQLGNGSTESWSYLPVQVTGLTDIVAVETNRHTCLALKKDGTVWVWGENDFGQMGNNNATYSTVPIQINSLTGITAIAAGYAFNLALQDDGTVWSWGINYYGQLGSGLRDNYGSYLDSKEPVKVSSLSGIIAIAAGRSHSIALRYDGTVWNWGWNTFGQLGNGSTVRDSDVPVQVTSLTGITAIDDAQYSVLALKNDGTVWSWGRNDLGQLGDGTTTDSNIPVQVSSLTDVKTIKSGRGLHSFAVKNDGTLWAWGSNNYGSFGTGNSIDSHTPILISDVCSYSLGIKENFIVNSITVYPNPSKGIFQLTNNDIDLEDGKLEIYNMLGKKVYTGSNIKSQTQFNLSNLSKGVYILKVHNGTKVYNKKIIIE